MDITVIQEDKQIFTTEDLLIAINAIQINQSVMDFKWEFNVMPIEVKYEGPATFFDMASNSLVESLSPIRRGWLLWASFERPDIISLEVGRGRGRDEIIWEGVTVSSAVKTAWVIFQMLVQHEMMEAFRFDGARIFNPHSSVYTLASIQK